MQIKTYSVATPPPIPSTPSPYDPVTRTKLLSTAQPEFLVNLNLATGNVLQCCVKCPDTGEFFSSQAHNGSNGSDKPFQSFTVSRCDASGVLIDSMELKNAGHGTSFGVEYSGGVRYLWVSYAQDSAMSQTPSYDFVRVPYRAGSYTRATLVGATVMPKLDAGYSLLSFDWAADLLVVRTSNGRNETYQQRKISEMRAGVDKKYGVAMHTLQAPPTMQGMCLISNTFFRYIGAGNGNTLNPPDPLIIQQYSFATGQLLDKGAYPTLGTDANGQYPGGVYEPESCTSWRDPTTGLASLIFGITMNSPGHHTWPLYIIRDIGDKV